MRAWEASSLDKSLNCHLCLIVGFIVVSLPSRSVHELLWRMWKWTA